MRLIDADTAQPGLTITANEQSAGKGQRGRQWAGIPGQSMLMSIILTPGYGLDRQFIFNAAVSVAIAGVLQALNEQWDVRIKWPNDIIINDKKAGGVLIENVLRGDSWTYAVVGFGLNVLQEDFPAELPYATSLYIQSGKRFRVRQLVDLFRQAMIEAVYAGQKDAEIMKHYNEFLYRSGKLQQFTDGDKDWEATVAEATPGGQLKVVDADGMEALYTHGVVNWKWY